MRIAKHDACFLCLNWLNEFIDVTEATQHDEEQFCLNLTELLGLSFNLYSYYGSHEYHVRKLKIALLTLFTSSQWNYHPQNYTFDKSKPAPHMKVE